MSLPLKQTLIPFRSPRRLLGFPTPRGLVGRAAEVERAVQLIEGGSRIITLLGPPGIGKTSLAVDVAQRVSARLRGWFCDLSHRLTEAELCGAVMAAFDASGSPPNEVGDALATVGPALLVLDNFEQLVSASEVVLEWSRRAPEIVFLITSRERLAVDCERVVEVGPLAVSGTAAATECDAVRLFRMRAEAAGAAASGDLTAIREIVRRLDGVPLAIELAAARTRLLSPSKLAARLRGGDDLLTFTKRSPARHRTLADAIAWSWDLLADGEQRALACCSVFAGDFTVGAAERVLVAAFGQAPPTAATAITLIAALREKSLLHAAGGDRIRIFSSIRAFARKKLQALDTQLQQRAMLEHAKVYGEVAVHFTRSRLLLPPPDAGLPEGHVRRDLDNLIAALAFLDRAPTVERGDWRLEISAALAFVGVKSAEEWTMAVTDVGPALGAIISLAQQTSLVLAGRFDDASRVGEAVIANDELPSEIRAAACVRMGIHLREDGDALGARDMHLGAAALLGEGAPSPLIAMNTACLGRLACDLREHDEARRINRKAEEICERLGEAWLAALPRANLAQLEQENGEFERAEAVLERAIACFRTAGEPHYEGFYGAICAGLYFEWGKTELARRWHRAAHQPIASTARAFSGVVLHGSWAVLEAMEGDAREAAYQLEQARRCMARGPGALARILLDVHGTSVEAALDPTRTLDRERYERMNDLRAGRGTAGEAAQRNLDTRFALRLLERVLSNARVVLRMTTTADRVAIDGVEIDLRRRTALRYLVLALASAHAAGDGNALDADTLFAAGWPGQTIRADSAATRVRVAIATLRKLGLRKVLLTSADGYFFDPRAVIDVGVGPEEQPRHV